MAFPDGTGVGKLSCWNPILKLEPKNGAGKAIDIPQIHFKHHPLRQCLAKQFRLCVAYHTAYTHFIQCSAAISTVVFALHAATCVSPASFAHHLRIICIMQTPLYTQYRYICVIIYSYEVLYILHFAGERCMDVHTLYKQPFRSQRLALS